MPRFYFNVHDGDSELDLEGSECADIYVAQAEAIRMTGEIMRDLGAKFWSGDTWRLEVTDSSGKKLFNIHFSAEETE